MSWSDMAKDSLIRDHGEMNRWKRKESYFTSETIDTASKHFLEQLNPLIHPDRCPFMPERSALLVLDMQRYFLEPQFHAFIPSAPAIIPGINRLIAAFKAARRPVILTRHLNTAENAGNMGRWWTRIITAEDPAGEIHPAMHLENCVILTKTRFDAFFGTELYALLRSADVQSLVITGVMTHICCDSTARSAFQHGFDVFFTVDGTATYNSVLHEASLVTLAHACARPVRVDEISDQMH